jgi:hypothetical protein
MYLCYSTLNETLNATLNATLNKTLNKTLKRTLNKTVTCTKQSDGCKCINKEVVCCFRVPFGFCEQETKRHRKEKTKGT